MPSPPHVIDFGADLAWDGGAHLYAMPGGPWGAYFDSTLLTYNIDTRVWTTRITSRTFIGVDIVWGGDGLYGAGCIFVPPESIDEYAFCRIDTGSGAVSMLPPCPTPFWNGGLCWDRAGRIYASGAIYAGCETLRFYDMAAGIWRSTNALLSDKYSWLAYDRLDADGVYFSGLSNECYPPGSRFWSFKRYDASLDCLTPVMFPDSIFANGGCALADGDCAGFLYAMRGYCHDFMRYAPNLQSGETGLVARDGVAGNFISATPYRLDVSPNPARGAAHLRWQIREPGVVAVRVFDNTGRVVRTIQNGFQPAGRYSARWDGVCDNGRRTTNGVFFCRMDAPGFSKVVKVATVGR